ncbi:tannase/feruloyl esterase family alpha/beta hydrolase [Streptomyces sp. NPDC048288]|uniref:tannase/feruloyl esterase family alpha/beta hydrolase n=2 Tax=unclassified Streptomyces TaxID=2593676 RepID=UPI0037198DF5
MGRIRRLVATLSAALLLVMVPVAAYAATGIQTLGSRLTLAQKCAAFSPQPLPNGATLVSTSLRAATSYTPTVCIARGAIVSSPGSVINWAVELPDPSKWNRKTLTIGGGGFDGFIPTDSPWYQKMAGPYSYKFVKISSDSGHQGRDFYPWATDDVALRNHAYDANHLVLGVGTAIATQFYGKQPLYRYMMGQSNGGRAGLAAAQRFPKDYDGVLALEPAISQQNHEANLTQVNRHIYGNPKNWLNASKTALFAQAEIKHCDGLDGLKDGVISNTAACHYIPTDLLCKGTDNDECLTAGQIESIRLLYSDHMVPVKFADGSVGYPRFAPGGAATTDWHSYVFGSSFTARESFDYFVGDQTAKVVTNDANTDYMTYNVAAHRSQWTRLSRQLATTDPDLSSFADNGGKLMIWLGMADTCVTPYQTAAYFNSVKKTMGTKQVASFARLLSSPAVGHSMDGPGAQPTGSALLRALVTWTEHGQAQDRLVAAKTASGSTTPLFTRPVCEYPKYPRYNGSGDTTDADNFTCVASRRS